MDGCPDCKGSGFVELFISSVKCKTCGGTGKIEEAYSGNVVVTTTPQPVTAHWYSAGRRSGKKLSSIRELELLAKRQQREGARRALYRAEECALDRAERVLQDALSEWLRPPGGWVESYESLVDKCQLVIRARRPYARWQAFEWVSHGPSRVALQVPFSWIAENCHVTRREGSQTMVSVEICGETVWTLEKGLVAK